MECEEFKLKFNIKVECCASCHEDEEMGFGEDLFILAEDGKMWYVCCAVMNSYDPTEDK